MKKTKVEQHLANKIGNNQCLLAKLNSPCDLLEKLRNDVKLLEEEVTSYRFFNFAVTGYHIIDWIKNNKFVPGATRKKAKNMHNDEYISICRDLANASKHFKFKKGYENRKTESAKSIQGDYGTGRFGKGAYGIGEEQITIIILNGKKYDAMKFARATLNIWDNFFREHKVTKQSPPTAAGQ